MSAAERIRIGDTQHPALAGLHTPPPDRHQHHQSFELKRTERALQGAPGELSKPDPTKGERAKTCQP